MNSGVYKILNIVNSDCYIGSTSNLKTRFRKHKYELKNNKHFNNHLQNAYNKYGKDSFIFEIIEFCNREILRIREQYYMNCLKPIYNKSLNADSFSDLKMKKESIDKIRVSKVGLILKEEAKQNMKNAWKETRNTHPLCKLNDIKVINLINEFNNGISIDYLVFKYKVKKATILGILSGRSWKDFTHLVDTEKYKKISNKTLTKIKGNIYLLDSLKKIIKIYDNKQDICNFLKINQKILNNMIRNYTLRNRQFYVVLEENYTNFLNFKTNSYRKVRIESNKEIKEFNFKKECAVYLNISASTFSGIINNKLKNKTEYKISLI